MSLLYPRHIKSGYPRDVLDKISLKATSGYPLDIPGITFRISGSFLSIFQGYPKDIGVPPGDIPQFVSFVSEVLLKSNLRGIFVSLEPCAMYVN